MLPVHRLSLPRSRRALTLGLAGVALMCGFSGHAAAQSEAEVPTPNVLLLVDNSGSMEFKVDGTFPSCVPNDTSVDQRSRWIELVEVLTGKINNYSCWAQDRSTAGFRDEFSINGVVPYDFGYVNPYHRALSGTCLVGPGELPTSNIFSFPNKGVNNFTLGAGNIVTRPAPALLPTFAGCNFSQLEDGLLDSFKNSVRFGLMTFDARVNPGAGYTPDGTYSSTATPNYSSGMDGNWSYFLPNSPATGHPANCSFDVDHEVGARNAAAPPWEGRMIAFGSPTAASNDQRNAWIQQTLLATRPYGATPINGQLYDARDFLFHENRLDPLTPADPTAKFGPKDDVLWRADDCRKTILILLTDGEPNLDLRPYCEMKPPLPETHGRCPYPEDSAAVVRSLRLSPPSPAMSVETYVVGFAMGKVTPFNSAAVSCSDVNDAQCDAPENNDFDNYPEGKRVQACCTLNEIAAAGRPVDAQGNQAKAFFAESGDELRSIFTGILSGVTRAATRTSPVLDGSGDGNSRGFKFTASFETKPPENEDSALWSGQLRRHRFVCDADSLDSEEAAISQTLGDDFSHNLNQNKGSRQFFSALGGGGVGSRRTIRPEVSTDTDGLGLTTSTAVHATSPGALASLIPASAMELVDNTSCSGVSANACRTRVLNHLVGEPNDENKSRCYPAVGCRLMGAIVHSTPVLVSGRPQELLRDESYDDFVRAMADEERHSVLYTSTVDGMLHAFDVAPYPGSTNAANNEVDSSELNELWAFLPPAVLPALRSQYPDVPNTLLDGAPVVKDVVASTVGTTTRFERLQTQALAGTGEWRTVLVQGFGEGAVNGGYFALDVTRPELEPGEGPRFLWQLTRTPTDARLFGNGGTPLITTVFLKTGTEPPREVAVAVLPGGDLANVGSSTVAATPTALDVEPGEYETTRTTGLNYAGAEPARSLTIVRLDTGEVVRTFRPVSTGFDPAVVTTTNIPAPITGQPAAFPPLTGAVADRLFVGDRDGRMWRVDVSSQNPANWTMKVFFDAFYDNEPSQPVVLAPVVSTDDDGAVTVAFATGDQQVTAAPLTMINRVVSLTERLDTVSNAFETKVNWVQNLTEGYRVTGPMALYNSALYYAASQPPAATGATCRRGSSKVYAAHYVDPLTPTALEDGPALAPEETSLELDSRQGMIFGVSLQQEPTCSAEATTVGGDDSFGYAPVSMASHAKEGTRRVAYTVSGTPLNAGSNPRAKETAIAPGLKTVGQAVNTPDVPVTFESWALIYE